MAVPRGEDQLAAIARQLSEKGDDAQRLELVQRTRRFKRSWVEMAEALTFVRDTEAYRRWGFADLQDYCTHELQLRGSTVEKLLLSYSTVREYAPDVLRRDGVARAIPPVEAVDYFAQAVDGQGGAAPRISRDSDPDLFAELKRAIFDDAKPLQAIRRQFNPLLRPRPEVAGEQAVAEKLRLALRRAEALLDALPSLSSSRSQALRKVIADLEPELEKIQQAGPGKKVRTPSGQTADASETLA